MLFIRFSITFFLFHWQPTAVAWRRKIVVNIHGSIAVQRWSKWADCVEKVVRFGLMA